MLSAVSSQRYGILPQNDVQGQASDSPKPGASIFDVHSLSTLFPSVLLPLGKTTRTLLNLRGLSILLKCLELVLAKLQ